MDEYSDRVHAESVYAERTANVRTTVVLGQWVDEMVVEAAKAMNAHLELLGFKGSVVINVEWTDNPDHGYMCIGSKVPEGSTELLASSLRRSAEEIDES